MQPPPPPAEPQLIISLTCTALSTAHTTLDTIYIQSLPQVATIILRQAEMLARMESYPPPPTKFLFFGHAVFTMNLHRYTTFIGTYFN